MGNPFPKGSNDAPLGQQRLFYQDENGNYIEAGGVTPFPFILAGSTEYQQRIANDSFTRLKTASPVILFDEKMTYRINDLYDQLVANGATIVHDSDLSGALLSVDSQADSRAVLQMAQYAQYQSGSGHEINITYGNITLGGAGEFRAGYFDDDNGIFISYQSGVVSVTLRTSISGSVDDTDSFTQANWNIDKMDGSGPSGLTLNLTGRQIFAPDLEWLSVGTVQVSLVINRQLIPIHAFNFANTPGAAYMTTADLPCRWELLGDGSNVSSVVAQCCSVKSYGGDETPTGLPFSIESAWVTGITDTPKFLMAIRPKATFGGKTNHINFEFLEYPVVAGSESIFIRAIYNPVVTGGAWADVDATHSGAQVNSTATISGGRIINSFGVASLGGGQGRGEGVQPLGSKLPFTVHIDGSLDIIAFEAFAIDGTGTGEAKASLNFVEQQ